MTSIAERGKGSYCFLETAAVIPKLVSKSVHQLLAVAGTDARLDIRGVGGAVVTKVYGEPDGDNGCGAATTGGSAALGIVSLDDLHSDNVRAVLVEFEAS